MIASALWAPTLLAADEGTVAAARACAEIDWTSEAGAERAATYRRAVACFKALYVRVASRGGQDEAFEQALGERLDRLEAAFHAARDVCALRSSLGADSDSCGTLSLSPHEFVRLLKTMVLNEDAGWVRPSPALAEALKIDR